MNICKVPNRNEDYLYVDDVIKRWVREIKSGLESYGPSCSLQSDPAALNTGMN